VLRFQLGPDELYAVKEHVDTVGSAVYMYSLQFNGRCIMILSAIYMIVSAISMLVSAIYMMLAAIYAAVSCVHARVSCIHAAGSYTHTPVRCTYEQVSYTCCCQLYT
jgi:hypothetical protein